MDILLANPRGFCAGVDRAIDIVNRALEVFGSPIYVRHEVVHNRFVVEDLRNRGAVFVEELHEVPDDAIVIFSAHGVTKVHVEVAAFSEQGRECVLIGHAGHPEVEGTMGQYSSKTGGRIYLVEDEAQVAALEVADPSRLSYVTQTTLSVDDTARVIDALRARFPQIEGPRKDDICYATQNRQDAVKTLAETSDVVLVVGSPNSSNSNRLRELAERCGARAYLLDDASTLDATWIAGAKAVGVTAGASAPELLVQGVIDALRDMGAETVISLEGQPENITFSLPKALRIPAKQS
jgi:4-hydroxy-3-methylbut-2-en-1-yl diphosphate reductase